MSIEKCIENIENSLSLDNHQADKIYRSFWKFVEERITKNGSCKINGLGNFYLEEDNESFKKQYILKFKVDNKLINKLQKK